MRAVIFLIVFLLHANISFATTVNQSFSVTASIAATCTVSPINALAFGSYDFANILPATAQTAIVYQCTTGVSPTANIGLNAGNAPGATTTTRKMQNGSNLLSYNLYSDPTHLLNWGNNQGVDTVPIVANGNSQSATVYGTIPTGQAVTPGSYADTITATLTY